MSEINTRDFIIASADRLFYEKGFDVTSFADIAQVVKISRGNFYYHFKTKDEILAAVIESRLTKTQAMLDAWEAGSESPKSRLLSFANILIANQTPIMRYGCPVGTLCMELAKLQHASRSEASKLFLLFHDWLKRQFSLLGYPNEAERHAMHLLMLSQGVATLANTFKDEAFIRREVDRIHRWLEDLEKNSIGDGNLKPKRRSRRS